MYTSATCIAQKRCGAALTPRTHWKHLPSTPTRQSSAPPHRCRVLEVMVEADRRSTGGYGNGPQLGMNLGKQRRPGIACRHRQADAPRAHPHARPDLQQAGANGGDLRLRQLGIGGQPDLSPWRFLTRLLSCRYTFLKPVTGLSSFCFQRLSSHRGLGNWRKHQGAPTGSLGAERVGAERGRTGGERVSLTEAAGENHQHVGALPHIGAFCPFADTVYSEYPETHVVLSWKWLITLSSGGLTISAYSFPPAITLPIPGRRNRAWYPRKAARPFRDDAFVES